MDGIVSYIVIVLVALAIIGIVIIQRSQKQ